MIRITRAAAGNQPAKRILVHSVNRAMPFDFTCNVCFRHYQVKENSARKTLKCKQCGTTLVIPFPGATSSTSVLPFQVSVSFQTKDLIPEMPAIRSRVRINNDAAKNHQNANFKAAVGLRSDDIELDKLFEAFRKHELKITRYFVMPKYPTDFWEVNTPKDCVGALLGAGGSVSVATPNAYSQITPISSPFFINGRPELDSESRSRRKPCCLEAGGIPIVSDEMLATLQHLGAQGETADIIYRGSSKRGYDMPQPGFKRFLISPAYEMPGQGDCEFDFLPEGVPERFGICCMLRTKHYERSGTSARYEVAVESPAVHELRKFQPSAFLTPIFRRGGPIHQWVTKFEELVQPLMVRE